MQNNLFISSSKLVLRRFLAIVLLAVCTFSLFYRYTKITQFSRIDFYDFYRNIDEDTVDVLCVGSSHVYYGVNPVQMWNDYGIAAYDLAGGAQSIWFSYYYLKEALKTQSPEVVILDVYSLAIEDDYFDAVIELNLVNMAPSYNKWEALGVAGTDNRMELFWRFPIFHSRYSDLDRDWFDLDKSQDIRFLGYQYSNEIFPFNNEDVADMKEVKECLPLSQKTEEYLRQCIELCQKNNINIVLTNTPWPGIIEDRQKHYNSVQKIADEYGVPFINGCLLNEEIGMDYAIDGKDSHGHLNYTGAVRYTKWLTEWLVKNYTLPDRRMDERWAQWQKESERLGEAVYRDQLAQIDSLPEYLKCIENKEYIYYVVSLSGEFDRNGTERDSVLNTLESKGINVSHSGIYVRNYQGPVSDSDAGEYNWWHYFNDSVLHVSNRGGTPAINWNNENCLMVKDGINVVVYDELLDEVIGQVGFDAMDNYEIVRPEE